MENQIHSAKSISWTMIIILVFVFVPAALFLMVYKLHQEKDNYIANTKVVAIVGWLTTALGVFYLIIGFSAEMQGLGADIDDWFMAPFIFLFALFGGFGGVLILHAKKYRKRGEMQLRYLAIVTDHPTGSLDEIAAAYPKGYDEVCHDLQKMIKDGFFSGWHLNLVKRAFVSPNQKKPTTVKTLNRQISEHAKPIGVVKCPNCGATNEQTDEYSVCDYCGSPLVSRV